MDQVTTKKITPAGDRDIYPILHIQKTPEKQKNTYNQTKKQKDWKWTKPKWFTHCCSDYLKRTCFLYLMFNNVNALGTVVSNTVIIEFIIYILKS